MTIGIYALYWEEQDLVYIGLSQNIESRFKDHFYDMKAQKHSNYKVQNAFNSYGVPELVILEECLIEELNDKEIQWMNEFGALGPRGLCIVEGGRVGFGTNSNASKYSRRTVLKIFSLLYRTTLSHTCIKEKLKLSNKQIVADIFRSKTHTWLKEYYPEQYKIMRSIKPLDRVENKSTLQKLNRVKELKLKDVFGNIYTNITNIREFCKTNSSLNKNYKLSEIGISRLLNKERKSYKGWTYLD